MISYTSEIEKDKFLNLVLKAFDEDQNYLDPTSEIDNISKCVERWIKNKEIIYVVVDGESYIGFSVALLSAAGYTLKQIWIDPEYRGKKLGVDLFNVNEKKAIELDQRNFVGKCHPDLISFFENSGCEVNREFGDKLKLFNKDIGD
jgi:GNAT superfamily N-acetyltransferase